MFAAKHTLSKQQLLGLMQLQRLLASDTAKQAANKQRLLAALSIAANTKQTTKAVFMLYELAQAEAANSKALLEAA